MKKIRIGELFCGPGGLGLGAKRAAQEVAGIEYQHSWANDIDSAACETYRHNVADNPERVYDMPVDEFLAHEDLCGIDGLLFGFPCNDFSLVGQTKGLKGEFGGLYRAGVQALDRFDPDFFVAENVTGLSSANSGEAIAKILSELSSAGSEGYHITVHKYEFEKYHVPQKRKRFIITGFKASLPGADSYCPPAPFKEIYTTAEALQGVEDVVANNESPRVSAVVVERLKRIQPGQNAWNAKLGEYALNVKGAKLSNIYRRLRGDEPAYTVTGSGGGGTHMYHFDPNKNRPLTNRERARLQTFPDDFVFKGSINEVRKQIGMAVPVKGADYILRSVFRHLLDPTRESTRVPPSLGRVRANQVISTNDLKLLTSSNQIALGT